MTNWVDHVWDGSTPGSTVLWELIRHFHPVLSPSCVAEDSRSGDRFQVVVAHVFRWTPVRRPHVRGGVGRRRSLISLPSGRLAALPNQRSLLCTSNAGILVSIYFQCLGVGNIFPSASSVQSCLLTFFWTFWKRVGNIGRNFPKRKMVSKYYKW